MPSPPPVAMSARLPRDVHVLSLIAFLVAVGFGVMVPVLPVFAREFGVSNFMVGAVISSFAAFRLLTSPFLGRLNRLLGERIVLGSGMGIVAVSTAAAGLATSFGQLLVMRALGGIGSAMFTVAAMTLLLRSVPADLRGRASARYSGGFLIGGMAGPAVGGVFAAISLRAPFFFYAGTLLAAGAVGLMMLSGRTNTVDAARDNSRDMTLREAVRDIRYRAALATGFGQGWQSFGVRSSLVPVLVVEGLLRSPTWTGIAFAIAAVAQTLALGPAGRQVDTRGRRSAMIAAGLISGVAALAMPWAPSIWVLVVVLCIYGVGGALHATAPAAVVGDVVSGRGSTPVAVYSMTTDLGAIVGPLAAGLIADRAGLHWAFAAGAALLVGAALYSTRMPRDDRSGPRDTPQTA